MMMSISVIIPNFNHVKGLNLCLKSLRSQNYDQSKLEILVADGGSTDNSQSVVKKYLAKIIPEHSGSPESAKAIALKFASNPYILFLATDNILPNLNWLKLMTQPFLEQKKLTAAYPLHYQYRKADNSLNRYFALIGANDPLPYFLGKGDRQSHLSQNYQLKGKILSVKPNYYVVQFNPNNMPTLGDNGFLIKKTILSKAQVDPQHFFHIDVIYDLVKLKFDQFAVVKTDIAHQTGDNLISFLLKRLNYMHHLYLRQNKKRRYLVADIKKDGFNLILYSIYSLTLILPFIFSIKAFLKIKDKAWFWHAPVCFGHFVIYTWAISKYWFLAKINNFSYIQKNQLKTERINE